MGNIEHRTSNVERRTNFVRARFGRWTLDVRCCLFSAALLGLLSLGAATFVQAGDSVSFGTLRNVKYRDYYDPPHQSQLRAVVQGSEAIPLGARRVQLKNLRIESFRENGEREGIIEAADCIYDDATRTASSTGPITAWTADERLRIEGTGFSVLVTNKSLTISNNVRTVIRDLGTNTKKP